MDRLSQRYGYLAIALLLAATLLSATGCHIVTFAAYVFKGNNVPAEYDGLKGKKVAVVCRPIGDLSYRDSSVGKQLAREIGKLLQDRVRGIEVVDARKVEEFIDENSWNEFVDVGEAVDADVVVGVDLQNFSLRQSQVLYQGTADMMVNVYECGGDGQPVFEKPLPQTLYPPNTAVPATELTETQFRRDFVRVLADQIGRHFYPHDRGANFAMDAKAFEKDR